MCEFKSCCAKQKTDEIGERRPNDDQSTDLANRRCLNADDQLILEPHYPRLSLATLPPFDAKGDRSLLKWFLPCTESM